MSTWSDFKNIISSKSLLMQYYDQGTNYAVWAIDHTITYAYTIWKAGYEPLDGDVNQITSDRTDFETNYKSVCNSRCGIKIEPFADPIVAFSGDGIYQTVTAGQTQNIDFKLTTTKSVYGSQYYAQNAVLGDYVVFQVVDVDNVLGYGANFVASTFINKWYVMPNTFVDVPLPLASTIPNGLYIRVVYTSTGATNVNMAINYYMTVKLP